MRPLFLMLALSLSLTVTPLALAAKPGPQTAPETHPVGDIPDAQAFVRYANPAGGYSLEVPEGWARGGTGAAVSFSSKLGQVEVGATPGGAPSVASVRAGVLATLGQADPSLRVTLLKPVQLPAGPAILARFTSTGPVNDVTGRRTPLENDLYVLGRANRQLTLRMWAPVGSDNVDAWNRVARSLVWR